MHFSHLFCKKTPDSCKFCEQYSHCNIVSCSSLKEDLKLEIRINSLWGVFELFHLNYSTYLFMFVSFYHENLFHFPVVDRIMDLLLAANSKTHLIVLKNMISVFYTVKYFYLLKYFRGMKKYCIVENCVIINFNVNLFHHWMGSFFNWFKWVWICHMFRSFVTWLCSLHLQK